MLDPAFSRWSQSKWRHRGCAGDYAPKSPSLLPTQPPAWPEPEGVVCCRPEKHQAAPILCGSGAGRQQSCRHVPRSRPREGWPQMCPREGPSLSCCSTKSHFSCGFYREACNDTLRAIYPPEYPRCVQGAVHVVSESTELFSGGPVVTPGSGQEMGSD